MKKLLCFFVVSALLFSTVVLPTGVIAADETDWNLANYEFDSSTLPADTINEGILAAAGCAAVLATGVVLTKKKKKSSEK